MPLLVDVSDNDLSAIAACVSAPGPTVIMYLYIQMYCDAPSSQVLDSQHAADHISSQIVEDQDLPYRLAV